MHVDPKQFFANEFESLTGHVPYLWQIQLFLDIISGCWPEMVPLPTGFGKTAVLHIWLIALAWSIGAGTGGVPRRLACIVNRRVVVDQVTEEAWDLLNDGLDRSPEVKQLLTQVSATGKPLALSTLRGQRADEGDWARDPSTPAIRLGPWT
jgi:CRISPR-associated endonuclease/helicase Cas3